MGRGRCGEEGRGNLRAEAGDFLLQVGEAGDGGVVGSCGLCLQVGQLVLLCQELLLEGRGAGCGLGRRCQLGGQRVKFVAGAGVAGVGSLVSRSAARGFGRSGRQKDPVRVGEGELLPGKFLAKTGKFLVASSVAPGEGGDGCGRGVGPSGLGIRAKVVVVGADGQLVDLHDSCVRRGIELGMGGGGEGGGGGGSSQCRRRESGVAGGGRRRDACGGVGQGGDSAEARDATRGRGLDTQNACEAGSIGRGGLPAFEEEVVEAGLVP